AVAGGQSVAAAARSFGVSRPTIYKALKGTR
ncbi:recombinase family protein, partial [Micrococcus endophyticus]